MKIQILQHISFEDEAFIAEWASQRGHGISRTRIYQHEPLPTFGYDMLLIMGGPMSVNDENKHSWLIAEKEHIRGAIDKGKGVLGICLGAQLIANAIGAKVYPNNHKEIGWHRVYGSNGPSSEIAPQIFPDSFMAFHWHGETFDMPDGATRLFSSEACRNQGFIIEDRVIGLQFHLESSAASIEKLLKSCPGDLDDSTHVQSVDDIKEGYKNITMINEMMAKLLMYYEKIL
jgi:GMP synthase-like glutamine amidotransferase